jgi:kinesin family protein 18/19
VLQVIIETKDRVLGLDNEVSVGKFILVDLAGSERLGNSKGGGIKAVESGNINKSLLALGNCINALADPKGVKSFIPWRDSKLTRLLKVILLLI